ncbi:FecR family protein [Galbibacter mesophilus]|uniref:FecR family protein n=1 Tax=Galbibacter mesophilus TaxID=379069 RepID=UPI00191FA98B|nr:FecR domain-containing protein [Galbibacter mesophilus]MCM5663880.1 FecR domain-containing protein [Galbibacter mesophilus]
MKHNISNQLLSDYFSGEATASQKRKVELWLNSDKRNIEYFYKKLEEWEIENADLEFEGTKDFQTLKERIELYEKIYVEPKVRTSRRNFIKSIQRIAAVVLLLLIGGASYYYYDNFYGFTIYETGYGEMQTVLLPDNSKVILNANSNLKVPKHWGEKNTRQVWLDGEAFFSVQHTKSHQKFLVFNNDVKVEVLGTEFNVNGRRDETRVVLNSGKVKLNLTRGELPEEIVMKPGESVKFERQSKKIIKKEVDTKMYTSWRYSEFNFEKVELSKVGELLEDNYGLEVEFESENLKNRVFTAVLPADNLEVLLKAISKSFGIEVKRQEDTIIFKNNK